jgi:ABC-type phosphate transport system substrate-binding protein
MKGKLGHILSTLGILGILLCADSVAMADKPDDLLIIANNGLALDTVNVAELRRLYFRQISQISGQRATPIHARRGSALRNVFLSKVMGMSAVEDEEFWEKEKIRTGAVEPSSLDNTLRAVFSLKGSISYCFRSEYKPGTAKILLVL